MANFTAVAGAVLTAATWNANVRDQVVTQCTAGTRPATPVQGQVILETDTKRVYIYDGAAWVRIPTHYAAAGRCIWRVRRVANQSISAGATTALSFDTEDEDTEANFTAPGTTITIPAAAAPLASLAGLYVVSAGVTSVSNNTGNMRIVAGGVTYICRMGETTSGPSAHSVVVSLASGATVTVEVNNTGGAAGNFTGFLHVARLGA